MPAMPQQAPSRQPMEPRNSPNVGCSTMKLTVSKSRFVQRTGVLLPVLLGLVLAAMPQPAQAGLFSVSPDKERRMGDDAAREIEGGARIVNGPVAEWVETVGQRLAAASNPEFKYSFRVIDSPEINAFALPGGY